MRSTFIFVVSCLLLVFGFEFFFIFSFDFFVSSFQVLVFYVWDFSF